MSTTDNHASYSPSSLKYFELCPCYQKDNSGSVHPVTLRGTAMHKACETGDMEGLDSTEKALVHKALSFVEAAKAEYTEKNSKFMDLSEQKLDVGGYTVYFGYLFGICVEKTSELVAHLRKFKG